MRLHHDPTFCMGCKACQQACWETHNLSKGSFLLRIAVTEQQEIISPKVTFSAEVCHQCSAPVCVASCSLDAIAVHKNGAVVIDAAKCRGCDRCTMACPFHAVTLTDGL